MTMAIRVEDERPDIDYYEEARIAAADRRAATITDPDENKKED
jgi:hypothetical protein